MGSIGTVEACNKVYKIRRAYTGSKFSNFELVGKKLPPKNKYNPLEENRQDTIVPGEASRATAFLVQKLHIKRPNILLFSNIF